MSVDSKVSALTATLRSEFWKGWEETAKPAPWEDFTTIVPSTTRTENFVNATPVPGFAEWLGHRNYGRVDSFIYSIRNRTFSSGFLAELEDIEDDQVGFLQTKPKELVIRGKKFPGRMVLKLLGQCCPGSIQSGRPLIGSTKAFDGIPFFATGQRTPAGAGFGTGDNIMNFQSAAGGPQTYNLVALYYGDSILKPLCWQNRSGPEFETNSGTPQSSESRQVRWWATLRGAPFLGFWWNAVLCQIAGVPNVAEVHQIFALIEAAFRTFTLPQTSSTDDGELVHEQTEFEAGNLYIAASTPLGEVLRQALGQDWAPQSVGGSTVATTNSYKGFAKKTVSAFLN